MAQAVAEPAPLAEADAAEIDERFEYDAPRFYDFEAGSPADAQPDGWFDTEGPKGLATPAKLAAPDTEQQQGGGKPAQGAAALGGPENSAVQQQAEVAGKGGKGKKGAEWRRALAAITNSNAKPVPAAQPAPKPAKRKADTAAAAGTGGTADAVPAGAINSRPTSAATKQQHAPDSATAAAATTNNTNSQAAASRRVAAPKPQLQHRWQPAATVAQSPRLHSHQRSHHDQHKTSEDLELERVEAEKEVAARLRRHNAAVLKHVLAAPLPAAVHSNKPLTEPVGLELNTSKRRRMHGMETRSMASPFKSMAEQIAIFEGRLPGRSRMAEASGSAAAAAAGTDPAHQQKHHVGAPALTVPMSPQFATKQRARPPRFKPREVVEAEEMAAMPKFKARPLNKRILEDGSGHLGVPHVDTKPPTVPEPFSLKTDQRAAEHASSSAAAGSSAGAAGSSGVFVFGAQSEGGRVTRSRNRAKKAWKGELTQPEPFQLATVARGAAKRSAAADPQQQVHEARPSKRARKAAAEGPFQLATDIRGAEEEVRLEAIRRQQEERARQEAQFKALPLNKAALAGAWKPAPHAAHALTVPEEVVLHSDVRAAARRRFDAEVAAKQAELEAEKEALQDQQRQQEEEVREYRKKLGHKALPLPDRL